MAKNIVICCDGTGNTFGHRPTNVTRTIRHLALNSHRVQVAVYNQGVGAGADRLRAVHEYRNQLGDQDALHISKPGESSFPPKAMIDRGRGLLFGYGLKRDVRTLYERLSALYEEPDDRIFLFGFSRGAFTVRALAGLLYRCGLPHPGCLDFVTRFEHAWELYAQNIQTRQQQQASDRLRSTQVACSIEFLGLWDTVKSYGGLNPIYLPHLRHNPIVKHVRHALALHEQRAWFKPTTWGQLDVDACGAMTRIRKADLPRYEEQDIDEVWFAGWHSDIGGDEETDSSARIALRWMLSEAVNLESGIVLNGDGRALVEEGDPTGAPAIHRAQNAAWWVAEQVPRRDINNSGVYPVKKWAQGSDGRRSPDHLRRGGLVYVHETAESMHDIPGDIEIRSTRPLP
ncbi:T6SS phospholipase effector Tle1-like catalytic domain-containing protein [Streptomyces sp. NPDC057199]|uniref:T6SS phospholipase effector Tle1-like catalytic domain-containing protein n=1 Tax=Streptomyces sp. NPDC057199 TaxID=3346047 RepID=UPI0036457ECD